MRSLCTHLLAASLLCHAAMTQAGEVTFRVTLGDEHLVLGQQTAALLSNANAATGMWAEHLAGDATLTLHIKIVPGEGRAHTCCPSTSFVRKLGSGSLYECSAAARLKGSAKGDPKKPDIEMQLRSDYLRELWFDPDPVRRQGTMPADKLDAVSLFLHEIAHGLGMNGWLNPATGAREGEALSTYDELVQHVDGRFYFTGTRAMQVNGGRVLLSEKQNNHHHVGLEWAENPAHITNDLMNGVLFVKGWRYTISLLDLAILADCGLPVKETSFKPGP